MRLRVWLEETISKHSKRTVEEVNRDIDRDKILTADEALEYGLIDQVLTSRKAKPLAAPVMRRVWVFCMGAPACCG